MENHEILARMEEDIRLRGYSKHTHDYYLRSVRRFLTFANRPAEELDEKDIRTYLKYLLDECGLAKNSINNQNAAIRFLMEVTLDKAIKHKQIPRFRQRNNLPELLTKEELRQVFENATPLRNRAILMTIYGGGLRLSEVCELKISDIQSESMRIFIRNGKGSKDRYTLLSQANLDVLREYWKQYRPQHEDKWLFLNRAKTSHANQRPIQEAFQLALKRAHIHKAVTVHTLRACFATHLLEDGVDIFTVKRLLGHSGLRSLSVYMGVTKFEATLKSPLDSVHA